MRESHIRSAARSRALLVVAAAFAGFAAAQQPPSPASAPISPQSAPTSGAAPTPASAPAPADVCGRISLHMGITVLELWGTPEQAGFAQGWLCAGLLVDLFDGYVLDPSIMRSTDIYENMLRPAARRQMVWPERSQQELEAMYRGATARIGEKAFRSRVLNRPIDVDDLMAVNVISDWFGMMCSSFSLWGDRTTDGQVITGRNLDFPPTEVMNRAQMIVVHHPDGQRKGWIGVSWPGMIGVFTAMNADGVTLLMHDARGLPASRGAGFTPRSIILRESLETTSGENFPENIQTLFRSHRVMVGNNIHASAPRVPNRIPAVIFEYDANDRDGGVTIRDARNTDGTDPQWIACTNHMRSRQPATECKRFESLDAGFESLRRDHVQVDAHLAFRVLERVAQRDTLHSAVFLPAARKMYARIPVLLAAPVEFDLRQWLKRPTSQPAR